MKYDLCTVYPCSISHMSRSGKTNGTPYTIINNRLVTCYCQASSFALMSDDKREKKLFHYFVYRVFILKYINCLFPFLFYNCNNNVITTIFSKPSWMALCWIGFSNIEIVWIDTIPNIGIYKYTPEADTSPIAVYFYSSDSYSAASHVEIKFFNHFINIYIYVCEYPYAYKEFIHWCEWQPSAIKQPFFFFFFGGGGWSNGLRR